ncbi:alpha/beta-hydrolase [Setomelanomma holmii]|uniref:Alpha/beta-hydrolase n=1 Tax=Setomelanomma holmii TaxID=210430 RepID=A0A9P4HBX2_9PLEO|nr:alpha/beta-hydrolase [Setomelanomma holmii]
MDAFTKKTLKTSRGYTYTYYTIDGDRSLPTLFFQHGWPDNAELWKDVAGSLRSTNHPIIVPDLLGYDGTDKPTDPSEYKWDKMTKDLLEIINTEKADKFISIGHDWGSACASRMYHYHPDRVAGLILLNVAYMPPGRQPFDLDGTNALTEQRMGYPIFSYWYLFTADDGPAVLKDNVERLYQAMHGTAETLKRFFTGKNAMREWLTNGGEDVPLRPYAQDEKFRQAFISRMRRDGFDGPQCWYKAAVFQKQYECDSLLPEAVDKVNVPMLYIGAKDDAVCRPEAMYPYIQAGLLPHLEQAEMIDASHWVPYEKPQEVVDRIEPWLTKHYAK